MKTKPALQTQIPRPLSYELAPQVMVALEEELDDPDPEEEFLVVIGVITTVEDETEGRLHLPFW